MKTITLYTIKSSDLPYNLTIIDTPEAGFGDTSGIESIASQIKKLLSESNHNGIDQLHGIGFVAQAPRHPHRNICFTPFCLFLVKMSSTLYFF